MKNRLNKSLGLIYILLGCLIVGFTSCKDDDNTSSSSPMKISAVYLENARATTKKERLVEFVRLGQTLRLEGSGFIGLTKIYVNGYETYFNPVFVTDNNIWVQISGQTPTMDAEESVRNTIVLQKGDQRFVLPFEIREAAPSITKISHTMPQAGDPITIYGTGLQGVSSIIFPGNVVVTNGIVSDDEKGEWCTVTVPSGIGDNSGSLLVICANGGAYSPACFNYKKGLIHNFDEVQNYSWGSGIDNTALTNLIPASDVRPKSQGGYQVFNSTGNLGANSDERFWLNSTAIFSTITSYIPGSTAAADCGIQMDIYVEGAWNSGIIRFVMADGSGASRYCMIYQPVYVNKVYALDAFENPGAWFTITLPFALSADYEGKTLDDVVASMSAASYKQAGPWFENSGITDVFDAVPATEKVYFDNIRFVPLTTPTYSDFPDEE
ncbi:hypothetical protein FACS189421_07640 [Bacteroidia bacterium]|nr:hypothetical protein FACS189421_07640 [Bacteroidia bacterium]GHT47189.1 hypothetical protein FACS189440_06990 [Bacteroidia bacterium]